MRVLLSHPSVAPFVQQAAHAFAESGELAAFVTTLASGQESGIAGLLAEQLNGLRFPQLKKILSRRRLANIPAELVQRIVLGELSRLIVGRIDRSGIYTDRVWEWSEHRFDRIVASKLSKELDILYAYEHVALQSFRRAGALGIQCIYDVPAPEHQYTHAIMHRELEAFPELLKPYDRHIKNLEERRTARRREEFERADLVIAASEFTRRSFENSGMYPGKIKIVAYGAPEPHPLAESGLDPGSKDLNLLWAGTFNIRKGAHYLLRAWPRGQAGMRLSVYGSQRLPEKLLSDLPGTIHFCGPVPHAELCEQYLKADVLIFPTLCDGYGMVVSEALAHGLPVITTRSAGASDLIKHGVNGFLIEAASSEQIQQILEYCRLNREQLRSMRRAAVQSIANYGWAAYRQKLRSTVKQALANE